MTHYQNTARACRIVVDSDDYYFVINLTQTGCGNNTVTCATIATLGFPEILFQPDEGGGNFKFDGRGSIILTHYDYNDCEYGIIQVYNINSSFKECECLKKPELEGRGCFRDVDEVVLEPTEAFVVHTVPRSG